MKQLITSLIIFILLSCFAHGQHKANKQLTLQSKHNVFLTWQASTSTNVVGYYIYRSTVSGTSYTKINNGAKVTPTTFTDFTVASGTTYYYVVTAVDGSNNESNFSNQAVAVIPTP